MKKRIALIVALVPVLIFGQAPSQDKNYVHTTSYTVPVQEGQQATVAPENKTESVTYYDGMGRPMQSIGIRVGGNSESVIKHYTYDGVGRQAKSYMPYANDPNTTNHYLYVTDALTQTHQFYNTEKYEYTSNPYGETKFDHSALSRPVEAAAQGNDWALNSGHTKKIEYRSNSSNEVMNFSAKYLNSSGEETELVFNGYYPENELYKTIIKNENWLENQNHINDNTTEQFKDKSGRLILTRTFSEGMPHDTYYAYDKLGNLTYVLPPLASDQMVVFGKQSNVINSQINYAWVDLVQVDKSFANDYNQKLSSYENADILNADLSNAYDGQGGYTVTTHADSELVTLNITYSANQTFEIKQGEIASLKDYGFFKDTELGRLKGPDYDYLFLIKNNAIVVDGYGKLSSISQTFSSNTKLDYTKNYPLTTFYDVDPKFAANYESQVKHYPNSEILDIVVPNVHNVSGGFNISIDNNDIITLNINASSDTAFKLNQDNIIPLDIGRSMADRVLGTISGEDYSYTFEIKQNYLHITGRGIVTNISAFFSASPPPPPPTIDQETVNGLCYIYHYDYRNRPMEIKGPSKGWEYVVYDKLNRPILTQDAKQHINNQWFFIKYDNFGRTTYSGLFNYIPLGTNDNSGRIELQQLVNNQTNPVWFETKQTNNSNLNIVYSNNAYPNVAADMEVLTINYYDDYEGFNQPDIQLQAIFGAGAFTIFDQEVTTNTKSLATASSVKILNNNNQWSHFVTYYDDKARPIYAASKNEYLNTIDIVKNDLDNFNGRLLKTEKTHTRDTDTPIVTVEEYTYDHAGRLLTQVQTLNTEAKELLVNMTYDELGRVENKKVGGVVDANNVEDSNGIQTVDYAFNIRGWLKSINEGNTNNGDVFGFKLSYNNPELTGSTALFNGNISETHFVSAADNKLRSYDYSYDALNRLKEAKYHGNHTVPGLTDIEDYSLNKVRYDKNGNILELKRTGLDGVAANAPTGIDIIDHLTYFYAPNSNQLTTVNDNAGIDGFKDGINSDDDYQYDSNGNLVMDKNKGITNIEYNFIDLPTRIEFHNNDPTNPEAGIIEYVYDAMGTKLKKFKKQSNLSSGSSTYYANNMVYEQNNSMAATILQFIGNSQGYAEPDGSGGFDYVYQYKDHLGNVRLGYSDFNGNGTIEPATEIVQSKNYYPFGLDHQYGMASEMSIINGRNHKFKYNGQEHDESFGLNVTEMTFRQFDMALGRFHGVDKMAAHNYNLTPYHFGANNPIYFADPTGLLQNAPDFSDFWDAIWENSGDGITTWINDGGSFSTYGTQNFVMNIIDDMVYIAVGDFTVGGGGVGSFNVSDNGGDSIGGPGIISFNGDFQSFTMLSEVVITAPKVGNGGNDWSLFQANSNSISNAVNSISNGISNFLSNNQSSLIPAILGTASGMINENLSKIIADRSKYIFVNAHVDKPLPDKVLVRTPFGGINTSGKTLSRISTAMRIGGYLVGSYNFISLLNNKDELSTSEYYSEQATNIFTTFGSVYGLSWGVGWELGRMITNSEYYNRFFYGSNSNIYKQRGIQNGWYGSVFLDD